MIFFTSDLHFCHDKEFLYGPRGFSSVEEMNEAIVERWNRVVTEFDQVYVLGDLVLNDNEKGVEYIKRLNGSIHVILGNHDTKTREQIYVGLQNVAKVSFAERIKCDGITLFLTHYPCITSNTQKESLSQTVFNLHGHTHSKEVYDESIPCAYNVALDAHDCTPVSFTEIKEFLIQKHQTK